MNNRVTILGVPIDDLDETEAMERIAGFCAADGPGRLVATPNPEMIVATRQDADFLSLLRHSDLNLADGFGLLLAARLSGQKLRSRVTGTDMVDRVCAWAATNGQRAYFIGAAPGAAEAAATVMRKRHPGLVIAADDGGQIAQDTDGRWQIAEQSMSALREFAPILVFAGFGHGRQEAWLRDVMPSLPSVKVGIGVGGAFDFWSGRVRRAPLVLRRLGLEWLWRLLRQPARFVRIFRAVVVFPCLVIFSGK